MLRNELLCFRAKSKVCEEDIAAFAEEEASERKVNSWMERLNTFMIKVRNGKEIRYLSQLQSQ